MRYLALHSCLCLGDLHDLKLPAASLISAVSDQLGQTLGDKMVAHTFRGVRILTEGSKFDSAIQA